MIREWLSAVLRGDNPAWVFPEDMAYESILDQANEQGVVALLHEHLSQATGLPIAFQQQLAQLARDKARESLMREAECRRILLHLQQAGIRVLLLKGSALAYWAYRSAHLRDCSDIDLLFSSFAEARKAIGTLENLQYSLRDPALAGDLVSFEQTCVRDSSIGTGLEIDLHWQLSSSPIFAFQFDFEELNADAQELPRLGPNAYGLSPVHAFFNACMHRVQNMADGNENNLKWLYDLHLLATRFNPADWKSLSDIAIERKLAGVCLDGLQAARKEFSTPIPDEVFIAFLHAEKRERMRVHKMHGWLYIQTMSFMAFPGFSIRLRWLMQRLFPDTAYLRSRYGGKSGFFVLLGKRVFAGVRRLSR